MPEQHVLDLVEHARPAQVERLALGPELADLRQQLRAQRVADLARLHGLFGAPAGAR